MRRFPVLAVVMFMALGMMLSGPATRVRGQDSPAYWAGDTSLQPSPQDPINSREQANEPALSDAAASDDGSVESASENPVSEGEVPTYEDQGNDDPASETQSQALTESAAPLQTGRGFVNPSSRDAYVEPAQINVPMTNQTRQVLGFYGGRAAVATLNQMPRRAPIQPANSQPQAASRMRDKPFQGSSTGPTVSPFLNLFRENNSGFDSALDYYQFVRPQQDQQEANQRQQLEMQQAQRRLRSASPAQVGPQYGNAPQPGTSTPAHFMDTAQFYSGWQR